MRIRRNLAVLSHDWALEDAGRCDQQLVGWIAMERFRPDADQGLPSIFRSYHLTDLLFSQ